MNAIYKELEKIVTAENIATNEILAKHTTFKIGGPADYFITPKSKEQLVKSIQYCQANEVPYYILGKGSNVVFADKGYRGVIIQIYKKFDQITIEGTRITALAGVMLARLAKEAAEKGLSGLEGEAGIPGTVGGAVTMNAGAYGYEIKDHIVSAEVLDSLGTVHTFTKDQLKLGYRSSIIQEKNYIVLEAVFDLQPDSKEAILQKVVEFNKQRVAKQPLEYPSAGSTFKRPQGYFAGKLIMDAGLSGYRIGDIMVSEKHCGFVINVGNGTSKDFMQVIKDVKRIVYEKFQVMLEPEVRLIGEFD